ncbi:uncharacterized protein B0H18DRAFT_1122431 [Fomitopsis serialis]|uniref:uncharacterized protein n=1 Tax=Fomitopsis serialis TaxID=139415 RepID=UPI0020085D0E|nr:uncharacterized protein B0H18DRAFT_1122431 [Neoantrodia serialis]KAH9919509.1 hypothetical protein B0H18DRAFT_1122431 [Neoantrodia serialis]
MDKTQRQLQDEYLRKVFQYMRLVPPQGADSDGRSGQMLHDLLHISDSSLPHHFHYSHETNNTLYLHKLRSDASKVVCKMAVGSSGGERLRHEAKFYEAQATAVLRGSEMPNYYGLFQGGSEDDAVTCLVLEYCGDALPSALRNQKRSFREAAVRAFEKLHSRPVNIIKGGSYKSEDIIRRPTGQPCIVDFSSARYHMNACRSPEIKFDIPSPIPGHYPFCGELRAVAEDAWAWYNTRLQVPKLGTPLYYTGEPLESYWESVDDIMKTTREEGLALIAAAIDKYETMMNDRKELFDAVERDE